MNQAPISKMEQAARAKAAGRIAAQRKKVGAIAGTERMEGMGRSVLRVREEEEVEKPLSWQDIGFNFLSAFPQLLAQVQEDAGEPCEETKQALREGWKAARAILCTGTEEEALRSAWALCCLLDRATAPFKYVVRPDGCPPSGSKDAKEFNPSAWSEVAAVNWRVYQTRKPSVFVSPLRFLRFKG